MFKPRRNVALNSDATRGQEAVLGVVAESRAVKASMAASFCALVLVLASSSTASALEATAEQRAACTPDVFRLCSSDIPNVSRIVACLQREKPKLSSACRAVFNPPARTATRSVADVDLEWCAFRDGQKGQEVWQTWCRNR